MIRTQQRGPITDYLGEGPFARATPLIGDVRLARCVCVHGKEWTEGDVFEPNGRACRECVQQAVAELEAAA